MTEVKNIGMILRDVFPPDIRVSKEARTLIDVGYNVFLLAESRSDDLKEENVEGLSVRRVKTNYAADKLNTLRLFITFQDRLWRKEIKKFVEDFGIDVLHFHDIPLIKTGIDAIRYEDIPIIADLRENYPQGLQVWSIEGDIKQRILKPFKKLER